MEKNKKQYIYKSKEVKVRYTDFSGNPINLPKNTKLDYSYTYNGVKCGWYLKKTNNKY